MGEDRSFRTKEFVFGGVSVSIREGRLGDGLGARVWAIAAGACNDLARHPDFVSGRRVLEIGAGCGLCGLLAAKLGAESVVLSDVGLPVLRLLHGAAQDNFPERLDTFDESNRAECNGCPEQQAAIPAANAVGAWSVGNIHVRELDWRQSLHHLDAPRPNLEAGNCRGGDGREPPLPQLPEEEVYDVVLGTDVVYEREHATLVAAVLKHRLQAQGRALVSAAVRDCALFEQFEQELDRREMSWRKDAVTCIPELLDDRADYEGGFCHYFVQHATGEAVWNWP